MVASGLIFVHKFRGCTRGLDIKTPRRSAAAPTRMEWTTGPLLFLGARSQSQLRWTEINLDTPGSSIVTPYRRSAISIVFRLWVMSTNCVSSSIYRSISRNRPMLASSSGASISSRKQNGLGLYLKIANMRAIAERAFSPPERSCTL